MTSAVVENLKGRILALAGIALADLPGEGREILEARIEGLIATRGVSDAALHTVSVSLAKQYPKAVSMKPKQQPPNVTRSPPPAIAVPKTSTTPAPRASPAVLGPGRPRASPANRTNTKFHRKSASSPNPGKTSTAAPDVSAFADLQPPTQPSPHRVSGSVLRKRQEALADAVFIEEVQREVEAHEVAEQRQREVKAEQREQMRREMQAHARRVEAEGERKREERLRNRDNVHSEAEAIQLDTMIARARRADKLAKEKQEIEMQRQARRLAKAREAARAEEENARYRREAEEGVQMDHDVAAQRQRETRLALVDYLNESKMALEEKRRIQQAERDRVNQESMRSASPFLLGTQSSAITSKQKRKIAGLQQKQELVMEQHKAHVAEREQAARRIEEAAMAAERRTAEEMARRNEVERGKQRQMRAQLVESLDQEVAIHHDRRTKAQLEKEQVRRLADEDARAAEEAARKAERERRAARDKLRHTLASQIAEKESEGAAVTRAMKINQRPAHFLTPSPAHH